MEVATLFSQSKSRIEINSMFCPRLYGEPHHGRLARGWRNVDPGPEVGSLVPEKNSSDPWENGPKGN